MESSGFAAFWVLLIVVMLPRTSEANEPFMVEYEDCALDSYESETNKTGYVGWRVEISCNSLGYSLIDPFLPDYIGKEAECVVVDFASGQILMNESYTLDPYLSNLSDVGYTFDVAEDSSTQYEVKFYYNGSCVSQMVELTIAELETYQCEQLPETLKKNFAKDFGMETQLLCQPLDDSELYFTEDDNVTYIWTRNCSRNLPEYAVQRGDSLKFFKTQFEDAGYYQCEVVYNGNSRYVVEHQLCVRFQSTQDQSLTMECPDEVEGMLGQNINITCLGDLGEGKANGVYLYSKWEQIAGNLSCENSVTEQLDNGTDPRAQCLMHSVLEDTCYYYNPHTEPPNDIIEVSLTIRNVEESDFGLYNVTFVSNGELEVSEIVKLERKRTAASHTLEMAIGLSVLGFFILLVILVMILGFWHKPELLWYWKRHFGPYDPDTFSYTAYLAYYYDNNNKASQIDPSALIDLLEKFTEKVGGKPFNPERNVAPGQYDIENLCNVMKDCHRVIVVLTPEYVKDDLSILKVYKGFQKEIEEQRKVIFIHLPGANEAIEDLADAQKRTLKRAIKMNRSLSWSGQNPLDGKFKRRLEYFLPKLPLRSYDRNLSTSSQTKLTAQTQAYSVSSRKYRSMPRENYQSVTYAMKRLNVITRA